MISLGRFKLRHQLEVLIGIALVMMTLTQLSFYLRFQALMQERAGRYAGSLINQVGEQLSTHARNMEQGASTVAYNRHVQEYLTTANLERKYIILGPFVWDVLEYVRSSNVNIYDIILADTDGQTITTLRNAYEYQYDLQRVLIHDYGINREEFSVPLHTALLQNIDGALYYAYILPIFSVNPGNNLFKKIGSCIVVSNTSALEKTVMDISLSENSSFMVLDREDVVMAGNKIDVPGKPFKVLYPGVDTISWGGTLRNERGKIILQSRIIEGSLWKVVSLIPERELSEDLRPIRSFGLLLGILMIIALLVSAATLIRNITRPVSRLVSFIGQVGIDGNRRLEIPAPNEVGIIAEYINRMLDRIEDDTEKLLETQRQFHETELVKKQAELSALQNQINPHFLYNTLNCISSIALVNDLAEIVTISEAMVRIFRYSIKQSDMVYIRDEIDLIKDYMKIMNIRYPNRFNLRINLDEDILNLKTIKMILQPLVENAVYHGLEPRAGPGTLTISGVIVSENILRIDITDDGKGIGQRDLDELRNSLNTGKTAEETSFQIKRGIGLINIHRRVRITFGENYGIEIGTGEGGGTSVHLFIGGPGFKGGGFPLSTT